MTENMNNTDVELIEDIAGVNIVKADKLREAGYYTVDSLREATQEEISNIDGIGNALAARIKADLGERIKNNVESIATIDEVGPEILYYLNIAGYVTVSDIEDASVEELNNVVDRDVAYRLKDAVQVGSIIEKLDYDIGSSRLTDVGIELVEDEVLVDHIKHYWLTDGAEISIDEFGGKGVLFIYEDGKTSAYQFTHWEDADSYVQNNIADRDIEGVDSNYISDLFEN